MKVIIRSMEKKDCNPCFDLEMGCFSYKVRFDKELLYSRLSTSLDYGYSYVAIYKKKVIGHITSFVTRGGDIFVEFLCVKSEYKRKGVGRQLLHKVQGENPRCNIYLKTGSNNQESLKFYLSMNYEIHEVKGSDWKYRDILMVLKRR